jgi:hypothetical protein
MAFDITSKHPDFIQNEPIWEMMRDTSKGEHAVKAKNEIYLPKKSGIKAIKDRRKQQDAYDAYKFRAEFPNIVGPTIRGSAGLIHSKETTIELPTALKHLTEKATADGLTLDQLHRRITSEVLRCGRFGLLPGVDDNGDMFFARYMTETIPNWDETDGENDYVVLNETAMVRDPLTNKWEKLESYRELLVDEGRFRSRLWVKDSEGEFIPGEDDEDATVKGRELLDFMPFVFIGSQDMTASPDEIPMHGLGSLALRAYLLDADYMNTLHMTSEPTPWVSGVSKEAAPKTIGAASLWVLENDLAKAGMLEFSGPGVDAQERAILNTLQRAVMFGAQLFQDSSGNESGEAKKTRLNHETSTLKLISASSAQGLEKALKNAAIWAGANPDEVKVDANMDFVDHELSPQEITALVASWMQGAYSKQTLFENLQRGSVIDERTEFEEEEERIAEEAAGVLPDDGTGLDLEVEEPAPDQDSGNVIQITQALDRLNKTLAS